MVKGDTNSVNPNSVNPNRVNPNRVNPNSVNNSVNSVIDISGIENQKKEV